MNSEGDQFQQPAEDAFQPPQAVRMGVDDALKSAVKSLGIVLCLFTLVEVNFPQMQPQSALAVFVGLGLMLCFLAYPLHPKLKSNAPARIVDVLLALASAACCAYVVIQNEPFFKEYWSGGLALGDRAGGETSLDVAVGIAGTILVLEATRRSIGLIVPLLALAFIGHTLYCHWSATSGLPQMPAWMLPHSGQAVDSLAATAFLQSLGVFGPAASVMFKYVFLFVVFGAFLELSGATQFIIDFAERVFGKSPGGPAKVSVLGSGLMGSLSGSAVANAVTTGTFTIPMMRNAGFAPHIAAGITAAAASGGALVPPVMGAGAYMMLELVKPQVTFLEIAKAALIPAVLYYLSIYMIVHFYSRRVGASAIEPAEGERKPLWQFEAWVFFGALVVLVGLLIKGYSPFRAVSGSLVVILVLSTLRKELKLSQAARALALTTFFAVTLGHHFFVAETVSDPNNSQIFGSWLESSIWGMLGLLVFGLIHPAWRPEVTEAFSKSARNGIALVAASACVGIIIGIVQQTGIAGDFSSVIKDVVETNLFVALLGIMVCSIVLGMGVPSVVCYLLMATLMGSLLSELGVIPLAAHLFIFYFGMMSMVTPPVALAAYASAGIADSKIMPTAFASFRFALVGFTLPFMFVYRPELLLLSNKPEVTVSLAKPKEVKTGEPARVRGRLERYGKNIADAELKFTGKDEPQTARTDDFGGFELMLEPGDYSVMLTGKDGKRPHLGRVVFNPDAEADSDAESSGGSVVSGSGSDSTGESKRKPEDQRLRFEDERLSILDVVIQTGAAVVGIIALAAGIAGFLFTGIKLPVRIGMLAAAALLLSPDMKIAGREIGVWTNVAGCTLFALTAAINWIRSRRA